MNKIYYVTIKGRTLESRDLKQLLARAVAAKRNLNACSRRVDYNCAIALPDNGRRAAGM